MSLDISTVVKNAQNFHYGLRVVNGIKNVVVLVSCTAHPTGSPRFTWPNRIAIWHDVKTVYNLVDAICKVDGCLMVLKLKLDVAASVRYVRLGFRSQLRGVFHVAIPSMSSVCARRASIKLPAIAES